MSSIILSSKTNITLNLSAVIMRFYCSASVARMEHRGIREFVVQLRALLGVRALIRVEPNAASKFPYNLSWLAFPLVVEHPQIAFC